MYFFSIHFYFELHQNFLSSAHFAVFPTQPFKYVFGVIRVAIHLFCKSYHSTSFKCKKNQEGCEVWWLRTSSLQRYKGNCGNRNRPRKFRIWEKQASFNASGRVGVGTERNNLLLTVCFNCCCHSRIAIFCPISLTIKITV